MLVRVRWRGKAQGAVNKVFRESWIPSRLVVLSFMRAKNKACSKDYLADENYAVGLRTRR